MQSSQLSVLYLLNFVVVEYYNSILHHSLSNTGAMIRVQNIPYIKIG